MTVRIEIEAETGAAAREELVALLYSEDSVGHTDDLPSTMSTVEIPVSGNLTAVVIDGKEIPVGGASDDQMTDAAGDETEDDVDPTTDTRVDHKQVAFHAKYCGDAAKPFYASGPREGQWKKKGGAKGPGDKQYDEWYAGELLKVLAAPTTDGNDVDAAAAFGGTTAPDPLAVPQGTGELMGWISKRQAAELLDQPTLDAMYLKLNLPFPASFFPPLADDVVQANINTLVAALTQ